MTQRDPAYRRHTRRIFPLAIAYLAATFAAVRLIDEGQPATAATYALAVLPAIPVVGWIWAFARLFAELQDEYLRLLEIRKAVVATGFMLVVYTVWGAFEMFAGAPGLPGFFAFSIWCLGLVPGCIANRLAL